MLSLLLNYLVDNINQANGMWEIMVLRTNTRIHFLLKIKDSVKVRVSLVLPLESLELKYSEVCEKTMCGIHHIVLLGVILTLLNHFVNLSDAKSPCF